MFAGGQLQGNTYSDTVDILDASLCYGAATLDPNLCMAMKPSIKMATARSSLAVASFLGASNIGGGAAMFAGGKTEVKNSANNWVPVPWSTSDFYVSAGPTSPILDITWFNLSTARFDIAGIGFDISGSGGKQQALFAGGTYADRTTSDVVDSYLFGGAIPDAYQLQMSVPRTRTQLGQLGNRYAIVAAGSTCAEWQPIDDTKPNTAVQQFCCGSTNIDVYDLQGASSTTPPVAYLTNLPAQDPASCTFTDKGSNCGICDLASASVDGWYVMAGGQYSLNASDPNKAEIPLAAVYALQYCTHHSFLQTLLLVTLFSPDTPTSPPLHPPHPQAPQGLPLQHLQAARIAATTTQPAVHITAPSPPPLSYSFSLGVATCSASTFIAVKMA